MANLSEGFHDDVAERGAGRQKLSCAKKVKEVAKVAEVTEVKEKVGFRVSRIQEFRDEG